MHGLPMHKTRLEMHYGDKCVTWLVAMKFKKENGDTLTLHLPSLSPEEACCVAGDRQYWQVHSELHVQLCVAVCPVSHRLQCDGCPLRGPHQLQPGVCAGGVQLHHLLRRPGVGGLLDVLCHRYLPLQPSLCTCGESSRAVGMLCRSLKQQAHQLGGTGHSNAGKKPEFFGSPCA